MKYQVNSPIGGFGNHLRWLLLLDSRFNFTLPIPDFDRSIHSNPINLLTDSTNCHFGTIKQKLSFIQNYVYPQDRSWHNWLIFEVKYRHELQPYVFFNHDYDNISDDPVKTIACTISPNLAYKSYLKFNSNCNLTSADLFKKVTANNNWHVNHLSKNDYLIINSDNLFSSSLDRNLYETIINFLNFDNHYDSANTVHQLWYNLHKKSEKEFVEYIQQLYS
jgi:hypothetical protein